MVKHGREGPERLSAYDPQIDNAVIGSDVVECEVLKNNILGNCFFPVGHVSWYYGSFAFRPTLSN